MRMRWYIVVLLALALSIVGLAGPCVKDAPCRGVMMDYGLILVCCPWDWGCWLNPFEPDGQWWCQAIQFIECHDGTLGFVTVWADECGPCCEPEPQPPSPSP